MTAAGGPRRILAAPDSFKGTHTAAQVAAAIARGARAAGAEAEEMPLADGGEGTLDALLAARGGEARTARATDPLGRAVEARFGLLPGGAAVIEVAAASGLTLVAEDERDPWAASSRGTGELIAAAAAAGASRIVVAAGGSATTDGGAGALAALLERGVEGPDDLPPLVILADVTTPFERAAAEFGPQKGADAAMVERLGERLDLLAADAPLDPRGVPMTGAAGGLAGGLWAHLGAELAGGAAYVLDAVAFGERAAAADLVVTGEGRLDRTSLEGKLVAEVAARCRALGTGCAAIAGGIALDREALVSLGLTAALEASTLERIENAAARLSA